MTKTERTLTAQNTPILNVITHDPSERDVKIMFAQCIKSPCLLCGGTAAVIGMFTPENSVEYGAGQGRHRQFFYTLCKDCLSAGGWETHVEAIFKNKLNNDPTDESNGHGWFG